MRETGIWREMGARCARRSALKAVAMVCVYGTGWFGGEWRGLLGADTRSIQCARPSSVAGSPSSSSFRTTMMLLVPAWTSADWLPEGSLTFRQRVNFVRAFKAHAHRITTPSGRHILTTATRTANPAFPQQSAYQTLPLDCPGRNSGIGSMTVGGVRPR